MKKLLILLVILGTASWANAARVDFYYDGSRGTATATPGSTVTIEFIAESMLAANFNVGAVTVSPNITVFQGEFNPKYTENVSVGELKDGTVNNIVLFGLSASTEDPPAAGEWLYRFDIILPSDLSNTNPVVINDWAGANPFGGTPFPVATVIDAGATGSGSVSDVGSLTITPEPMTIVLLGLGGLVLLRKRRA